MSDKNDKKVSGSHLRRVEWAAGLSTKNIRADQSLCIRDVLHSIRR